MSQPDKDASVLERIERLVAEEHKLFGHPDLGDEQARRIAQVQLELDQCWDLLRQRRALREYGADPAQAQARPPEVVKKYSG
jgi:Protein of unknown function (DUF2630)